MSRLARVATTVGVPFGAAYLALGVAGRLSGLAPGLLTWPALALPLAVGGLCSVALQRRLAPAAIARWCDARLGSDDLLVTAATITSSIPAHGFQTVVLAQAHARIAATSVPRLLPWTLRPLLRRWSVLLAVIALALATVPIRDPFGRLQHQHDLAARQQQLAQQDLAIRQRLIELTAQRPQDPTSMAVAQEMAKIQAQLEAMKPGAMAANHQLLAQDHAALSQQVAQARTARFDSSIDPKQVQELGLQGDADAAKAIASALEHGQAAAAQQAIDEAMDLADQLRTATPAERARLTEALNQKLATLDDAGKGQPSGLSAAIQHAMDSLSQAASPEARDQALQNLHDALDLAKIEAGSDAQGARDLSDLQDALKALHLADKLNDQGELAGASAKDLEDYAELYAQRLAELAQAAGQGQGDGTGAGGHGDGNRSDSSTDQTDEKGQFQGAQDHSPVRPGATIAEWHTHGPADAGTVIDAYQATLREVKQDLPEVLEREQVPEAYHAGVKKYFDGLAPHP